MSVRCPCSLVLQFSSQPLRRTARRIVRRWAASARARRARACWCGETCREKRARELAWRGVPQKNRREKYRPKTDKGQRSKTRKKAACVPQGWGVLCAMAAASLCVRSDLSNASPVQGARGAPLLCGGGNCRRVRVRCVVLAMMMCGHVTAGTRARASRSGRACGGVWQYERSWPVAPSWGRGDSRADHMCLCALGSPLWPIAREHRARRSGTRRCCHGSRRGGRGR